LEREAIDPRLGGDALTPGQIQARNLKLTVEYDGTDFVGFQTQRGGLRTVQTVLEEAAGRILAHRVALHAAGRTDTGVHALGQVVSFHTTGGAPTERLAMALNRVLPPDVAVVKAEEVDADFHARFSAVSRTYGYLVWTRRTRSAIWGRYSLHSRRPLDVDRMRAEAAPLIGTHDFVAYAKMGGSPGPSTIRHLERLSIRRLSEGRILFVLTANGFLRSMVRNLVGGLLKAGARELEPGTLAMILHGMDREANPFAPAPAHGLCLLRVDY
jgi:tRNA pseudouridine38-40 synthase